MSEGRRTRSAKSKSETEAQELPKPRATRRTKKQATEEVENEPLENENVPAEEDAKIDDVIKDQARSPKDDNGVMDSSFGENTARESEVEGSPINFDEPAMQVMSDELQAEENVETSEENTLVETLAEDENPTVQKSPQQSEDFEILEVGSTDTKTEDTLSQHEDLKVKDDQATDLDEIENISEDELPAPTKPKVQDAEEVSDEELPGPKMAELPDDTEVVSEEELPASTGAQNNAKKDAKRKLENYDPSEPTDENDEKKLKIDAEENFTKNIKLPELEKYWKAVKQDTEDFNAWTYLLLYVDSENDVEAAREAYDKFLARYPYCYGYWRKYADYEKKKGSLEKCNEVFERGLNAIPLSVDLWIHYLTHVKQANHENRAYIRTQFERALEACGLEFRSDKLWEGYIRWEMEEKNLLKVVDIYDRLLATPTQGYKSHMENFRELVNNNPVQTLVSVEEFKQYREEVRKDNYEKDDEAPPGLDEADDHVRNEEEADAIKKLVLSKRKKINKANVEMINKRWSFEEAIKRPYFHVKQLEKIQLKNWSDYLDFEIGQGNHKRILVLFERCLIACALYEEFWVKLIRYWEKNQDDPSYENSLRNVFKRACGIHHQDKPNLHLLWSAFEEIHGNVEAAGEILENLDKKNPNVLQIAYRRINLERRRGNFEKCDKLYALYLNNAKNKNLASSLAIKYARFLNKIMQKYENAMEILKSALEKDPTNTRLALQIIDLGLQRENVDEKEILKVFDKFSLQENLDLEQKILFTQRKVEFLEDFGGSIKDLQATQKILETFLAKSKENKKKSSENEPTSLKKSKDTASTTSGTAYNSSYNFQNYSSYTAPNQWTGGSYNYDQWSGSYYNSSSYGNYQHGSYGSSY